MPSGRWYCAEHTCRWFKFIKVKTPKWLYIANTLTFFYFEKQWVRSCQCHSSWSESTRFPSTLLRSMGPDTGSGCPRLKFGFHGFRSTGTSWRRRFCQVEREREWNREGGRGWGDSRGTRRNEGCVEEGWERERGEQEREEFIDKRESLRNYRQSMLYLLD